MVRLSRWGTVLILALFLAGNLILPLIDRSYYLFLPSHDHIILGPVQPGWENHPHGESISLAGAWQKGNHSYGDDLYHSYSPNHSFDATDVLTRSKIISIAYPQTGYYSVFCYEGQPLLLAGWLMPPDLIRLIWPLKPAEVTSLDIFLSPPDKPPKTFYKPTLASTT